MKKIILLIAAMLIIASVTGCDMIKKKFSNCKSGTLGDKVEDSTGRSTYEGANISLVSASSESITVKIENNSASTWQSGNMRDYFLEGEKDGEWYRVEQIGEFANTMELMIFAPGDKLTHTFEFCERYGDLPSGKYRVVKAFWANATATAEAQEFYLICEFTVE